MAIRRAWRPNFYPPRLGGAKGVILYSEMREKARHDPDLREVMDAESHPVPGRRNVDTRRRKPATKTVVGLWRHYQKKSPPSYVMKYLKSWERLGREPLWRGPPKHRKTKRRASHARSR